jgi:tetratricopeptide (TPR) repeat protein
LSQADERIGTGARDLGFLQQALQALQEDETVLNELLAAEPQNPSLHRRAALVHSYRMLVYYDDVGPSFLDATHALDNAKRYLEATEEMVRSDPRNTSAQRSRAIATYSVAFYLSQSDPNAAISLARDALHMFDDMITAGRTDYLTVSRRVRALRRLGEAELKAGRVKEATVTVSTALEAERKIAAQNKIGPDEEMVLVHLLILASRIYEASGNSGEPEPLLAEANERALRMAQNGQLTNAVSLAAAEQALGEFYARVRRNEEARATYQRLSELWQKFPEKNDYLEMQRAASNRLLASLQ